MTRTVRNGLIDYLVADDDPLPAGLGWWAVLRTRALDEITGEPPLNPISIVSDTLGCVQRVGDDGLCGLVARPRTLSRQLLSSGELRAEIRVEGYLPRSLTAAIDAARRTTPLAAPGDVQLTITPPEPAPRTQFLPGRGVVLEEPQPPLANVPDTFTLTDDPVAPPAANVVPIVDPVTDLRPGPGPWRIAGVPVVLPAQPLHRAEPAAVRGRALRQPLAGAPLQPAPGTQLGLTGVWWSNAEVPANSAPPHPADLVSFSAPLAFDHPGATLERLTARAAVGPLRAFASAAAAGATAIELDNVAGLTSAGGDTLELEIASSAERELVITAGFVPPLTGTRAVVNLAAPLAFPHGAATPVQRVTLTFAALGTLSREAQRGDRVLFASTLAGVAAADVLRIAGGTALQEVRAVRRFPLYDGGTATFSFPAPFEPDGSFELPPIARVAQLQLFVAHAAQHAHDPIDLVPDYGGDTTLQILFKHP
jgi:hypothetical protein